MASPASLAMHWLEQGLTALGTAAFAVGAWLLRRHASVQADQSVTA
jgi:hypothetical protein